MRPGEKGKCLECTHFQIHGGTAWCHAIAMRQIYTLEESEEDNVFLSSLNSRQWRIAATSLKGKREFEALKKLKNKVNPNWCPLRKDQEL